MHERLLQNFKTSTFSTCSLQVVASRAGADTCSVLTAENEKKQEHKVKTEVKLHVGFRRGLNPFSSRVLNQCLGKAGVPI